MAAAAPPAPADGAWEDTTAAQAVELVVGQCPDVTWAPVHLATLLSTSGAVRSRLQHTSGHVRVAVGAKGSEQPTHQRVLPFDESPKQPSKAALKRHATQLAAFAGWLPPHAGLVEHLSVECHDSRSTQPLVDAFKRCAAAAGAGAATGAALAAQPAQPSKRRVTRRSAAAAAAAAAGAARKLPPAAPVALQLRSLALSFRPPSAELLSPLATSSSSLTRLALNLDAGAPQAPGTAAALAQLRSLRSLALLNVAAADAVPALAQLSSLGSLEWRGLAWPQLAPLLAQLPASVGTLLLDLDMMVRADGDEPTECDGRFYYEEEAGPKKLAVDASGLQGLRSLDLTAAVWDDDGHTLWHGKLVPTLPPGLTRLVLHGRCEAVHGVTSSLQGLSMTEWWMDGHDLAALISTAAPSLRSLQLFEHDDIHASYYQRHYEHKEEEMTEAEGAALTGAIVTATQLTRLEFWVSCGCEHCFEATTDALAPTFAAAVAKLPNLKVLEASVLMPEVE